ncbi:MAG TPA: YugN family protein [Bacillales bacterium]|nr:YugN family protein [Bacillales bacterium]
MYFNDLGIDGKIVRFADLENVMRTLEMIRGGQWDWERVTYDHKFENRDTGDIYYLRVQGLAVKGEVEQSDAEIQLKTPILGHHYYPHGVEYDEEFPQVLVKKCETKLRQLKELLEDVEVAQAKSVQVHDVTGALFELSGVKNVGELHMWHNEEGHSVLSCHLIIEPGSDADTVLQEAEEKLTEAFGIEHTTIQIDREGETEPAGSES